eukprot:2206283-Pleurochrysis_carterae.AAC.2
MVAALLRCKRADTPVRLLLAGLDSDFWCELQLALEAQCSCAMLVRTANVGYVATLSALR